jgi:hypothetical protein
LASQQILISIVYTNSSQKAEAPSKPNGNGKKPENGEKEAEKAEDKKLEDGEKEKKKKCEHCIAKKARKEAEEIAAEASGKKAENKKVENGKGEKKCEHCTAKQAKKAEEDKFKKPEESKAMDPNKAPDNPNFTPEQDSLLLKLKSENTSWADIAAKMSLTKHDVWARHKELMQTAHLKPTSFDTKEAKTSDTKPIEATNDNSNSKDTSKDSGDANKPADPKSTDSKGRLKADENWTRQDCEILEMLEHRYREEKWLSIQSSFYNWTGRMIIADVIERKLKEEGGG